MVASFNKLSDIPFENVQARFREIWGYDNFRAPQGEIIQALLNRQDALIVMPTGGGKSICFQLPALMRAGVTIVISPLVALIENQVQELKQRGLSASLLHSEVSAFDRRRTLSAIAQNRLRLLYLSPETLLSEPVWQVLCQPTVQINGLILDEAHCLVQWGDTFRPAYRRLGAIRPALLLHKPAGTQIPVATFTATANPTAQQTLCDVFQLKDPKVVRLSPYRSNLNLRVKTVWTPRGRKNAVRAFLKQHQQESGLIYVRTRRETENLAHWLSGEGYKVLAYHAGLAANARRKIETEWIEDRCQFVVCTSAFGMGINKHTGVRWILHYHTPTLLSEYVQEIGRAGRDGERAETLTLVSERTGWFDTTDKQRQQGFQQRQLQQLKQAQHLAKKIPQSGSVELVCGQFKGADIALGMLHSMGQLTWKDPFHYTINRSARAQGQTNPNQPMREMNQFLRTKECRWKFILKGFGADSDAAALGEGCGHCDRCQARGVV